MNKNEAAKLLARIINCEGMTEEEEKLWEDMEVSTPINNNFIVTVDNGTQFNVQVKDVSK